MFKTKRIYDPSSPEDGYRLLVMRLWPRGIRKDAVDGWQKELGPSLELLRAWRSGQLSWETYAARYRAEVSAKTTLLEEVRRRARQGTITLLCSCQEEARCHRTLLKAILEGQPT